MASMEFKLKPWRAPSFAVVDEPPRPKQEGWKEARSIPVAELSDSALRDLAQEWLSDLYRKADRQPDWRFE